MIDEKILFTAGHTACAGCGQSLAARLVIDAAGPNTIVVNNTGCLEVFSTGYPYTSWRVPFIHSLFENAGAVASGIESALRYLGKRDVNVIAQAGDGGFADIGLQAFSGLWERGHNVLTICYDNEAYMNTGIQRSGTTPTGCNTTTSPVGKTIAGNLRWKKNLVEIALAHRCVYVATSSVHLPVDLQNKVKKALKLIGPKFIHILCPCPLGWGSEPSDTIKIAQIAVESGFWPLVEFEEGRLTKVRKLKQLTPIEEYFKLQRRFHHLLKEQYKEIVDMWKNQIQKNVEKYQLLGN
ncbi:MAG: thiamine pyrophosphate-dependent enzyme [Endomicrobia bacterium]|nr:thiamine pyrophosphate-dependent enzyme [Endomicrobiia bacterium]MCX7941100.1 thiamine pyrophosphate-dependent enzyme [Endomicrobiia bacterium]MDW8055246.1 thiamine pyrophosphate-dependent enzyme [Elusimicrobiota bacterium]